ncbi:penicillin-binding transpeptidase domain-containing protein [Patulibacter minatonensis]|uniref:penicillin-binding transpeptidase domain-containing protein n=1 Tax=Patulibacter minatonensis TaxID=298163 RepID=UPI0004793289|nr:penicillin-binding transpeptidase domain-containing protein [Patulibacter minatonensis]
MSGAPARPRRPSAAEFAEARRLRARRRRLLARGSGAVVAVVAAAVIFLLLDARAARNAEKDVVERYVRQWGAQDFAGMWKDLGSDSRLRIRPDRFVELMRGTLSTATATSLTTGEPRRDGDGYAVPVTVRTRVFGVLRGTVDVPLQGSGDDARIDWTRRMALPGLRAGERLTRTTTMPARADLLARDGTVLASGPDRRSDVPGIAGQIVGSLGTPSADDLPALRRLGVPADATVGVSGLERQLNAQLVGTPGGTLEAGDRVIARADAKKAAPVRSSIDPNVVKAAAEAQANAPDATGTVVLNARTGEVLAFQGGAWTDLQPPGSTMKIVTASAAIEDRLATTSTVYPRETEAKGFGVQNSDGELCGGTLVESFADSCNSVFVPLGAKLGGKRLVQMAEAYGFNRDTPGVIGDTPARIPDPLPDTDAPTSAIGQAAVEATALQVALLSATIANGGMQPRPTFLRTDAPAPTRRVVRSATAAAMRTLMSAVISEGTGKDAKVALPGITTAGKTGTAELASTQGPQCDAEAAAKAAEAQPDDVTQAPEPPSPCGNADGKSTTAWMSAFAPVTRRGGQDPIAIGVLRAKNFQGGATAAPVAKAVLTVALQAGGG